MCLHVFVSACYCKTKDTELQKNNKDNIGLFTRFAKMYRSFLLSFLLLLSSLGGFAETPSHLRISLLTCGTGKEAWETFGHTAVRVTDSTTGEDVVFNYGMFNGFGDGFLLQFVRGKLPYYVAYYPYQSFLQEYRDYGRSVSEQELTLSDSIKTSIRNFLLENCQERNKYYKYDFFFDNCATRIRDIFPTVLGKEFHYGNVLPTEKKLSFRNIINQYFYAVHWQRFGVNLVLGSKIDKAMTNDEIMFLPDFLSDGVAKGTLSNQPIAKAKQLLVIGNEPEKAGWNEPMLVMLALLGLTLVGFRYKKWNLVMNFLLLFFTGLLGCVILIMWFATDHQTCQNNYNLLWALPTNLLLAFLPKKNKDRYALVAILLLLVAMLVHLTKIQEMPLTELSPLLLALLLSYGSIYRHHQSSGSNHALTTHT